MTSIKLTSDGYSFHTMELKIHPDSNVFHRALSSLYAAAKKPKKSSRTTYPISRYKGDAVKSHCSTLLSHHGILLYLTETIKNGWHNYTIKAIVNPRRVLDPKSGYLGIAPPDEKSLERFSDEFTLLMRKYRLPEFLDGWTLTRLDLCVNLQLNKKKSARELCRLLQKDLLPPKMERILFYNPKADPQTQEALKEKDQHSICLANNSYRLTVYDKLFQTEIEGLEVPVKHHKGILRVELSCLPPYLDKLLDQKETSTFEQIMWLAQHSRSLILKAVAKAFSSGTHYKPEAAKVLIDESGYHKSTQKQLWWLFKRMRYPFSTEQLEKGMEKQFKLKPRTVAKRLDQLQKLDINLSPLRKDFYLEQLPSLPLLLELLEDDSISVKLSSEGKITY